MGEARAVRRMAASPDAVWDAMSWRGMARMAGRGLFAAVEFEDDRADAGALKRIVMADGAAIRERLEWVDETARAYGYRVLDGGGAPIASYEAVVRITGMGPGACAVVIECRYVPVGVGDEAYAAAWVAMEDALLAQVAAMVETPRRI